MAFESSHWRPVGSALLPILVLACSSGGGDEGSTSNSAGTGVQGAGGATTATVSSGSVTTTTGSGGNPTGGSVATGAVASTSGGGTTSTSGNATETATGTTNATTTGTTTATTTGTTTGGAGAGGGSGDDLVPNAACTIDVTAITSETIGTVGIVSFTTDLGAVDAGYIDFGLDESYGMRAPLDLGAANFRTLLLGMTQNSEFHYRVVVKAGDQICQSADAVISTASAPSDVPTPNFSVSQADKVAPGFLVTSTNNLGGGGGGGATYVLIFNQDGALVWWSPTSLGSVSRAGLSHDSKYMYVLEPNPGGQDGGQSVRIAMDGSGEEDLSVTRGHHDLCIVEDGVLILTGGGTDSCGEVTKIADDGSTTTVYDIRQAFGDTFQTGANDPCHCNSIHYNPADDTITMSCLSQNAFVKVGMDGTLHWVLGGNGSQSHFTGDIEWNRQHGHHMLSATRLVFFNNNGLDPAEGGMMGGGGSSLAVEMQLDLDTMVATRTRAFDGGHSSQTFGDAQILLNDNLLVNYCNDGVILEVDSEDQLVAEWTFSGGIGYSNQRPTLYGLPPRQ